jgi:hypothetical protein
VSEVADAATAVVVLADYAAAEPPAGKINAIGVGWQITAIAPTGGTPPQTIVVLIDVPQSFAGEQVALTLSLRDATNNIVEVPQPDGSRQSVRIAQLAVINKPAVPGVALPRDMPARVQVVVALPTGLALQPGELYTWQLDIDGTRKPEWATSFYVVAPAPPAVLG